MKKLDRFDKSYSKNDFLKSENVDKCLYLDREIKKNYEI